MTLDPFYQRLLADVLVALVPILAVVLTTFTCATLKAAYAYLKHRLTQAQMQTLEHWVRLGVFATEQYLKSADGEAKKEWCVQWVQNQLNAHGLPVNVVQIADMAEGVIGQEKLNLAMIHPTEAEKVAPDTEADRTGTGSGAVVPVVA